MCTLFPSNDSFGSSLGENPFIKNCGITFNGVHNETRGRQKYIRAFILSFNKNKRQEGAGVNKERGWIGGETEGYLMMLCLDRKLLIALRLSLTKK